MSNAAVLTCAYFGGGGVREARNPQLGRGGGSAGHLRKAALENHTSYWGSPRGQAIANLAKGGRAATASFDRPAPSHSLFPETYRYTNTGQEGGGASYARSK